VCKAGFSYFYMFPCQSETLAKTTLLEEAEEGFMT
jgi:hypothetical protein